MVEAPCTRRSEERWQREKELGMRCRNKINVVQKQGAMTKEVAVWGSHGFPFLGLTHT